MCVRNEFSESLNFDGFGKKKPWMFLMLFTVELELSCLTDFD